MLVKLNLSMSPQLSPNGHKLAYSFEGEIWIVPISGNVSPDLAGVPVKLAGVADAASPLAWSGDGQWIAYSRVIKDGENPLYAEMCIVPSSDGSIRQIAFKRYLGIKDSVSLNLALSPNGDRVAFTHRDAGQTVDFIYVLPIRAEEPLRLTEGSLPTFSPDGQNIAFVKAPDGKWESDVWIIPAAGGIPRQVSNLPGRAVALVWSPDGSMIAFITRPSGGSRKLCIASLSKPGIPGAAITTLELPFEPSGLYGWTTDDRLGVVSRVPSHDELYTVPAEGGQSAQLTDIKDDEVYLLYPRWSPDGSRIFLQKNSGLFWVPSEGGKEVEVPVQWSGLFEGMPGGINDVSPDGKTIVFMGAQEVNEPGRVSVMSPTHMLDIYSIPVEGGIPRRLTKTGNNSYPCWSPDGTSLAFIGFEGSSNERRANLYTMPAEGGLATKITSLEDNVYPFGASIAWSPDGKLLAYFSGDNTINIITATGDKNRILVKVNQVTNHSDLTWSPDGQEIAYVSDGNIWATPLDGGSARRIAIGTDVIPSKLSWSPDGSRIAFTASRGWEQELWLVRDFLPLLRGDGIR